MRIVTEVGIEAEKSRRTHTDTSRTESHSHGHLVCEWDTSALCGQLFPPKHYLRANLSLVQIDYALLKNL